ncbi:MAG: glycosyltransferase [Acaryochloridaceae cyanobacterium RL_2_7]|nr:glycosyltransferase [Acaryochloridaceae cyanobacterium RL_2_7]
MMDVSIIIPTYNRLWSLPKTIKTCQESEVSSEIIIIDDGSTDGTWEWLQQQSGLVILQQQHLGKPWAVNRGMEIAQGEYIRFLDSDDWLCATNHDKQVKLAQQNPG